MPTVASDVFRFNNSLQEFSKDFSGYNLMLDYLMLGLEQRIPPEIGISGVEGTIELDALLSYYLGKKIDKDEIEQFIGDWIDKDEIERIAKKIEDNNDEWKIYAKEYGEALAFCLITEFGRNISVENYKEYGAHRVTVPRNETPLIYYNEGGFLKNVFSEEFLKNDSTDRFDYER